MYHFDRIYIWLSVLRDSYKSANYKSYLYKQQVWPTSLNITLSNGLPTSSSQKYTTTAASQALITPRVPNAPVVIAMKSCKTLSGLEGKLLKTLKTTEEAFLATSIS